MFSMFRPFDTARDMLRGKNRHYALHERFLAFHTLLPSSGPAPA